MSEVCNKILPLDITELEEKSALGLSVSIALHASLSNCFKAIEILETNRTATGAEAVYFRAAISKLETAEQALRKIHEILARASLPEAAVAWLKALDYDRLYAAGTKRGQIPRSVNSGTALWSLKSPWTISPLQNV